MKTIKAKLQTRKPGGGLLGAELAELAKAATAKDVPKPDEELNEMVVEAINSNSESSAFTQVRDVLHKRMNMKNPHKVWLATHLADDILKKCPDTIGPIKSDIYQDLAAIAGKPLDRYQVNFKDEQRAKMHAFAVLRSSKQGQSVLRHTLKMGRMVSLSPTQQSTKSQQRTRPLNAKGEPLKPERTNSGGSSERAEKEKRSEGGAATDAAKAAAKAASANGSGSGSSRGGARAGSEAGARTKRTKMTFEEATQNVTKALGVAGSHTSMIQDLVMNIADGKSEAPDFERQFLGELSEEVVSFRTAFESLVSGLMSFKRDEAQPLVQQALEAIDDMNNALALTKDVTDNLPPTVEAGRSPRDSPRDSPRASAAGASSRARAGSTSSGSRLGASAAPRSSKSEAGPSSGRRSPLQQYAPAATALRSNADTKTLESSIAALGLGQGKSGRSKSSKEADGTRTNRPSMQRANSTGRAGPDLPAATMQQPGAMFGQPGAAGGQPQFFMQGPVYYPPQGQQQMPYAPAMAQQPVLYMPVTGPNGEQGFAPVVVPPGSQFPPSGGHHGGMQMPMGGGFPAAAGGQMHTAGGFAGSSAIFQPPYAPSAPSATSQPANGQQFVSQPIAAAGPQTAPLPMQLNGSSNPFAPTANGSAHAPSPAAQDSEAEGGVTDSESEVPRVISFNSLGSGFHRGSRDQLAGGNIPHVVSASSDIFPAATASGVLADAGLTGFVPATAPAPESQVQQSAPALVPQAAEHRKHVPANQPDGGTFDKVFEELVQ